MEGDTSSSPTSIGTVRLLGSTVAASTADWRACTSREPEDRVVFPVKAPSISQKVPMGCTARESPSGSIRCPCRVTLT